MSNTLRLEPRYLVAGALISGEEYDIGFGEKHGTLYGHRLYVRSGLGVTGTSALYHLKAALQHDTLLLTPLDVPAGGVVHP